MLRLPYLLIASIMAVCDLPAQDVHMSERAAKEAVYRIVQYSGLLPNFIVRENRDVPTAVAYIKDRERVIEYNPVFISAILDSTCTNWSALSILAHEIAHHLLGHTLHPEDLYPGDELACDRYSGFILHAMGATLEESLAAIKVAGNPHGTRTHPPEHAREMAIEQGWENAERLSTKDLVEPFSFEEDFQFMVHFEGDKNTYYVNAENKLVWFDNYAEPIEFGTFTALGSGDFVYQLTWEHEVFFVDARRNIWSKPGHAVQMMVGRMEAFARK